MKISEAQKRASRNYYLKHKEYYSKKANENTIKMRKERKEYKARIERAIDYLENASPYISYIDLRHILTGEYNE